MKKTDRKIKLSHILILIFTFIFVYVLANAMSVWNYAKIDEKRTADVAIVLGAGADDEGVTPVFRERINHGVWLYQNGYVDKIILTGGRGDGNEYSDAYVAKEYALTQGVPETDILIEEASTITQENIAKAKVIMDNNGYTTAIIVSDPLHMRRAMLMAEDYGITAYSSPTPTTMYTGTKSRLAFLAREVFFYIGYNIYRLF